MNGSRRRAPTGGRFARASVAVIASVLLAGADANAQAGSDSVALPSSCATLPGAVHSPAIPRGGVQPLQRSALRISTALGANSGEELRRSSVSFGDAAPAVLRTTGAPARSARLTGGHRAGSRKLVGGLIGATAGFFAGAYLGAAIEGQGCACDDPGLKGAMIGAPIGTVVGAVLGVKLY